MRILWYTPVRSKLSIKQGGEEEMSAHGRVGQGHFPFSKLFIKCIIRIYYSENPHKKNWQQDQYGHAIGSGRAAPPSSSLVPLSHHEVSLRAEGCTLVRLSSVLVTSHLGDLAGTVEPRRSPPLAPTCPPLEDWFNRFSPPAQRSLWGAPIKYRTFL